MSLDGLSWKLLYVDLRTSIAGKGIMVAWQRFDFYPGRRRSSFASLLHLVRIFFALAVVDET